MFAEGRQKLRDLLESKWAHITVIALTGINLVFLIIEVVAGAVEADEGESHHKVEAVARGSFAVICIFMVELVLRLIAFGPEYFYREKHWQFHLLDAVAIIASFVLELVFWGRVTEVVEVLILFRIWRVFKLLSTVVVQIGEHEERLLEERERRIAELEKERKTLLDKLALYEEGARQRREELERAQSEREREKAGGPKAPLPSHVLQEVRIDEEPPAQ